MPLATRKGESMETQYIVDFGSINITKETKDKLENDKEYLKQWIKDNAYLDQIIEEKE